MMTHQKIVTVHRLNGFVNEFAGSFLLFFGALALTNNYFGHKLVSTSSCCMVTTKETG